MTPWVRRLIVANVVVFAAQMAMPSLTPLLWLRPAFVLAQPWTLITYMFLHGGVTHILFNMLFLYFVGPRVEQRLGGRNFIVLYFVSGIGGALASFATPSVPIVGASAAIMGVMMAYALYWPRERFFLYGVIPVQAWLLVLLYVVLDVAGTGGFGGAGVAHLAHLGGLASGFLCLKVMEWRSPARTWKKKLDAPTTPSVFGDGDALRRWREIRIDDLHPVNRDEVVRLLDKAGTQGTRSLTAEERATLNRFAGGSS
jgi:membrane associated rhomboid family serine protease